MFRRRRFARGRRPFRGFRSYPKARQRREYVTLFTDDYGFDPPAQGIQFPTGVNGAWSINTPSTGRGEQGLPRGPQGATTTADLPRSQHHGFTSFVPLWSWEYYEYFGHDVTLKALRGYLFPQAVSLKQNTTPLNSGTLCKVRFALMMLETAPAPLSYGYGNTGLDTTGASGGAIVAGAPQQQSPVPRLNIWSFEDFDHHRMLWYNDWFLALNNPAFTYWSNEVVAYEAKTRGGNELQNAGLHRSNKVRLGRKFGGIARLDKDKWLWLVIGIAGASAFTGGTPSLLVPSGTGNAALTLDASVNLQLFMNGHLRAFLTT